MGKWWKDCFIEFLASGNYRWSAAIYYPNGAFDFVNDFPSADAAYLAAIQKANFGRLLNQEGMPDDFLKTNDYSMDI
ncbi:MAG TPA: hypothetical protein VK203_07835 [Nostocaceae cyanobacterium]|nr:hypothetical protein [Nostocaceae cyanobacterium]